MSHPDTTRSDFLILAALLAALLLLGAMVPTLDIDSDPLRHGHGAARSESHPHPHPPGFPH
jgi:hypothetical protein